MTLRYCPHCNGDLDTDKELIEWGYWAWSETEQRFEQGPGVGIHFTKTEGRIISALLRANGRSCGRETSLYAAVCANKPDIDWPELKIVDVLVTKIRKKLAAEGLNLIETNWGSGYRAVPYDPEANLQMRSLSVCSCGHHPSAHMYDRKNMAKGKCKKCDCKSYVYKTEANKERAIRFNKARDGAES